MYTPPELHTIPSVVHHTDCRAVCTTNKTGEFDWNTPIYQLVLTQLGLGFSVYYTTHMYTITRT